MEKVPHSGHVLSFLQDCPYGSYTLLVQSGVVSGFDTLVPENHRRATNFHIMKSNSDMATRTQAMVLPKLLDRLRIRISNNVTNFKWSN